MIHRFEFALKLLTFKSQLSLTLLSLIGGWAGQKGPKDDVLRLICFCNTVMSNRVKNRIEAEYHIRKIFLLFIETQDIGKTSTYFRMSLDQQTQGIPDEKFKLYEIGNKTEKSFCILYTSILCFMNNL